MGWDTSSSLLSACSTPSQHQYDISGRSSVLLHPVFSHLCEKFSYPSQLCSLKIKASQILFVCLNVLSLLSPCPPPLCFRYLLLCMARHAGSSTARDYSRCNWLFPAWFDTSFLSDSHTSLLSSVMERRWGTHETLASSHLQRNCRFRFVPMLRKRKQCICVKTRLSHHHQTDTSNTHTLQATEGKLSWIIRTNIIFALKTFININNSALSVLNYCAPSIISLCPCFRDNWQPVGRIWYQIVWSSSFPSTLSKLTWLSAAAAVCHVHQAAEAM